MIPFGRTVQILEESHFHILCFFNVDQLIIEKCSRYIFKYSAESEYNEACTTGISIAHLIIQKNKHIKTDLDVVS